MLKPDLGAAMRRTFAYYKSQSVHTQFRPVVFAQNIGSSVSIPFKDTFLNQQITEGIVKRERWGRSNIAGD